MNIVPLLLRLPQTPLNHHSLSAGHDRHGVSLWIFTIQAVGLPFTIEPFSLIFSIVVAFGD